MPWFPFLLADLHSILNHIVPLGCAALLGRWRGQGHTATASLLSGRASNVNDISTEKDRLDSCSETQRLLHVMLADFHPLLIFSSRTDYLANDAVGPGRQRCSHAWASHQVHPLRSCRRVRSARCMIEYRVRE